MPDIVLPKERVVLKGAPEGMTPEQARELFLSQERGESATISQLFGFGQVGPSRSEVLSERTGLPIRSGEFSSNAVFRLRKPFLDTPTEIAGALTESFRRNNLPDPDIRILQDPDDPEGPPIIIARSPGEESFAEIDAPAPLTGGDALDIVGAMGISPEASVPLAAVSGFLKVPGAAGVAKRVGALTGGAFVGSALGSELNRALFPDVEFGGRPEELKEAADVAVMSMLLGIAVEPLGAIGRPRVLTESRQKIARSGQLLAERLGIEPVVVLADINPIPKSILLQASGLSARIADKQVSRFARALEMFDRFKESLGPLDQIRIVPGRLRNITKRVLDRIEVSLTGAVPQRSLERSKKIAQSFTGFQRHVAEVERRLWPAVDNLSVTQDIGFDAGALREIAQRARIGTIFETRGGEVGRADAMAADLALQSLVGKIRDLPGIVRTAAAEGPGGTTVVSAATEILRKFRIEAHRIKGIALEEGRDVAAQLEREITVMLRNPIGGDQQFKRVLAEATDFTTQMARIEDLVLTREILRISRDEPRVLVDRIFGPDHPDRIEGFFKMLKASGQEEVGQLARVELRAKLVADNPFAISQILRGYDKHPGIKRLLFSEADESALLEVERGFIAWRQQAEPILRRAARANEVGDGMARAVLAGDRDILVRTVQEAGGKNSPGGQELKEALLTRILQGTTEIERGVLVIKPQRAVNNMEAMNNTGLLDVVFTPKEVETLLEGISSQLSFLGKMGFGERLITATVAASFPRNPLTSLRVFYNYNLGRFLLSKQMQNRTLRVPKRPTATALLRYIPLWMGALAASMVDTAKASEVPEQP